MNTNTKIYLSQILRKYDIENLAHWDQLPLIKNKCKINVRTGFLDPENLGKDTEIGFR